MWIHIHETSIAETEGRLVVARGWWKGEIGSNCFMGMGFFLGDKNVLELDSGDGCRTLRTYCKTTELYTLKGGF